MKSLSLILLCAILSGCGAGYHLRRAKHHLAKAAELGAEWKSDTVYREFHDTIPALKIDTVLSTRLQIDTVRLEGGFQIVIKRDTVRKVERIQVSGPTVVRTIRVPVIVNKTISAPPDNRVKAWWRTVALVTGGLLALILCVIIVRIIR